MFAYVMVGTNNLEQAVRFYEPLMKLLGQERSYDEEQIVSWGEQDIPAFSVGRPYDGFAATVGNGVMLAFRASSVEMVKKLYKTALKMGGRDEGKPGLRPQYEPGFYAGYARDLDGNKLAFVCYGACDDADAS